MQKSDQLDAGGVSRKADIELLLQIDKNACGLSNEIQELVSCKIVIRLTSGEP